MSNKLNATPEWREYHLSVYKAVLGEILGWTPEQTLQWVRDVGLMEELHKESAWVWHDPIGSWMVGLVRSPELSDKLRGLPNTPYVENIPYVDYIHDLEDALWPSKYVYPDVIWPQDADLPQIKREVEAITEKYRKIVDENNAAPRPASHDTPI